MHCDSNNLYVPLLVFVFKNHCYITFSEHALHVWICECVCAFFALHMCAHMHTCITHSLECSRLFQLCDFSGNKVYNNTCVCKCVYLCMQCENVWNVHCWLYTRNHETFFTYIFWDFMCSAFLAILLYYWALHSSLLFVDDFCCWLLLKISIKLDFNHFHCSRSSDEHMDFMFSSFRFSLCKYL